MITDLLNTIIHWLTSAALSTLTTLFDLLRHTAFVSPDVTALPAVHDLSQRALWAADACYVLAIVGAGALVMARDNLQVRYGLSELAPRLVAGFVAMNMSGPLCRAAIRGANLLTGALTGQDLGGKKAWQQLHATITGSLNQATGLLAVVVGLLICVLAGALLVTWLVRIGVLLVLASVGPMALACLALPQTDVITRLWARSLGGCLLVQVLQSVLLYSSVRVLLTKDANLPALGIPDDPDTLLNLLIVLCLLWASVRIPSLVRQYVMRGTGGASTNPMVSVLRVVVLRRLTRTVASAAHRGPVAAGGIRRAGGGR